ncbi:MAG: hypothetical protein ACRDSP_26800, partial [Pseudonocardiaceae bacterium]
HVLSLPEASMYHEFHEQPLWELVGRLNELWAGTDVYYPFLSHPTALVVTSTRLANHATRAPNQRQLSGRSGVRTALIPGTYLDQARFRQGSVVPPVGATGRGVGGVR